MLVPLPKTRARQTPSPAREITTVAVKKLVVGSRRVEGGTLLSVTALLPVVFARGFRVLLIECPGMLAGLL